MNEVVNFLCELAEGVERVFVALTLCAATLPAFPLLLTLAERPEVHWGELGVILG